MNQNYIKPDSWSIIEEGFDKDLVKSSESIFSLGNGAMGQRANFEETYTGETFQGSYIAGVYYPDKTRVGWWKNGYPVSLLEFVYFVKKLINNQNKCCYQGHGSSLIFHLFFWPLSFFFLFPFFIIFFVYFPAVGLLSLQHCCRRY